MAYDSCRSTMDWFDRALEAETAQVRWRAIELLRCVDGPRRGEWLERAQRDPDPRVSATAVLVHAAILEAADDHEDLLESDFAAGELDAAMEWEWEYSFVVCTGLYVPNVRWLVWLRTENDEEARRLALLKAEAGRPEPLEKTAIIADKRYVNRYTRSPRTFSEALLWRSRGRPRYQGLR